MQNDNYEFTISDLIQFVVNWYRQILPFWKIVAGFTFIGLLIGVGVSIYQKPKYTAELTFALEDKQNVGALGAYAGIASQFGLDMGGSGGGVFSGDNMIELMKSRMLIQKTLLTRVNINNKNTLLIDRYIDIKKYKEKWAKKPGLTNISFENTGKPFSITQDSIVSIIVNSIKDKDLLVQKIDKKLSIITVKCTTTDEIFSKLFTENLVKNVTDFYIETRTKKSRSNVEILQFRTDSVKRELDSEMFGAAISQDQNLNIIRAKARVSGVKKQMNVQILSTMYTELLKNLEISKLSLMREEPFIQIIDTPILPLERQHTGMIKAGLLFSISAALLSIFIITIIILIKKININ